MSLTNQILATAIVCYLCMVMSLMFTWPSAVFKHFTSTSTPLNRVMTETEVSLLGSLSSFCGLVTLPFTGYFLDTIGRKYTCLIFSLLQVLSWTMVLMFTSVEAILAAVFISGVSNCSLMVVPMYVSEFCQESIRGSMSAGAVAFYGIGTLVSYLLGGLVDYNTMNITSLLMACVGTCLLYFMRESPILLMQKGLDQDARISIAFFRGVKVDSFEVTEEMDNIKRILNPCLNESSHGDHTEAIDRPIQNISFIQFMKKSRSSRYAFFLSICLSAAIVFQGLVVIQVYAEPIFETAVPNMSSTLMSVLFAVVSVIASFIAMGLLESVGRKSLMIYGSMVSAICCVILGMQLQMGYGPHWMVAALIYIYCIAYTIGAGTVPYVYISEIFLPHIKSVVFILILEWAYLCFFILLFIYNILVNRIGIGGVFHIFGVVCTLTSVFCAYFMPETKGLTVDAIQEKMVPRRYLNITS